jgi:conjugative transposon TraJ protein
MGYLIDIAGDIGGLQSVLQSAYTTLVANCSELIGISMAIAAFGALWQVAPDIWMRLQKAQPVEVEALFRPVAISICIPLFPYVIALINGVMQPTVEGTAALVGDSNQTIATLLQQKEQALQQSSEWQMYVGTTGSGSLDKWEELSGDADTSVLSGISNRVKFQMAKAAYNMKNSVKVWLSEILQVLYEAAALCINTVRTFYLVILAILGPLAFAFSVYPGFEDSLGLWLSRYLHVYLWLPVANIFGSLLNQIQQEMIKLDIAQLGASGLTSFSSTDAAYIIFLIMGIVGYFTVPSVTHYIVRSAGIGAKMWRTNLTL